MSPTNTRCRRVRAGRIFEKVQKVREEPPGAELQQGILRLAVRDHRAFVDDVDGVEVVRVVREVAHELEVIVVGILLVAGRIKMGVKGRGGRLRAGGEHFGGAPRGRHEADRAVERFEVAHDALHEKGLARARVAAKKKDPSLVVVKKRLKLRDERGLARRELHIGELVFKHRVLDPNAAPPRFVAAPLS